MRERGTSVDELVQTVEEVRVEAGVGARVAVFPGREYETDAF